MSSNTTGTEPSFDRHCASTLCFFPSLHHHWTPLPPPGVTLEEQGIREGMCTIALYCVFVMNDHYIATLMWHHCTITAYCLDYHSSLFRSLHHHRTIAFTITGRC